MKPQHYLGLLLALTAFAVVFNLVYLGLVIAGSITVYLVYLAWTTRNDPPDPRDY
jgi:hypothetical protein